MRWASELGTGTVSQSSWCSGARLVSPRLVVFVVDASLRDDWAGDDVRGPHLSMPPKSHEPRGEIRVRFIHSLCPMKRCRTLAVAVSCDALDPGRLTAAARPPGDRLPMTPLLTPCSKPAAAAAAPKHMHGTFRPGCPFRPRLGNRPPKARQAATPTNNPPRRGRAQSITIHSNTTGPFPVHFVTRSLHTWISCVSIDRRRRSVQCCIYTRMYNSSMLINAFLQDPLLCALSSLGPRLLSANNLDRCAALLLRHQPRLNVKRIHPP